jgi:hypothetical protein
MKKYKTRGHGRYSAADLGRVLGMTPGSVYALLHREGVRITDFDAVAFLIVRRLSPKESKLRWFRKV